jgi:uncharacterized membrane protein YccC
MSIPLHIWPHALRIWLAAVIALYVAFWLQLGGASSAAVTVAILAQPTRGAAIAKAGNRIAATFLGATMSIIIAGLFPGERVGMLAAFTLWLCACVFVASYFRGYRAYAAVLSGYTVAIITVANIDAPQNVFTAMTNRVAAITIGIICVTLVNDLFGSPSIWRGFDRRISAIWQDVREYARAIAIGGAEDPQKTAMFLARISGLGDEVDSIAHETADGFHRAAGGRIAMLALIEIVRQVRMLSFRLPGDPLGKIIADQCLDAADGKSADAVTFLASLRETELSRPEISIAAIGQIQQAVRYVESVRQFEDGLSSLRGGSKPSRDIQLSHRREFFFALQNTIRVGIAVSAGALFLTLAGWPASATALTVTAVLCALSTTMPSPSKFAVAVTIAFALAMISACIVRFCFLTETQDFSRLAIGIAPILIFGCLLSVSPKTAGLGGIINVIFLDLLTPSNPQNFNSVEFFSECMFVAFALGVVLIASQLAWPVSEFDRQRAVVNATKKTFAASVTGGTRVSLPSLSIMLASRLSDYLAAGASIGRIRPLVLRGLLAANDLAFAAAAAYNHLEQSEYAVTLLSNHVTLRRALQSGNSLRLYAGARSAIRQMRKHHAQPQQGYLDMATDLWSTGLLLENGKGQLRHFSAPDFFVRKGQRT